MLYEKSPIVLAVSNLFPPDTAFAETEELLVELELARQTFGGPIALAIQMFVQILGDWLADVVADRCSAGDVLYWLQANGFRVKSL